MRAQEAVALGDLSVTARELTVAEVRALLLTAGSAADPLQQLVFDGFGLGDLLLMCDASAEDLEALTPSELQPLVVVCQKLNPHFFRVRAALTATARAVQREIEQMASTGTAAC